MRKRESVRGRLSTYDRQADGLYMIAIEARVAKDRWA